MIRKSIVISIALVFISLCTSCSGWKNITTDYVSSRENVLQVDSATKSKNEGGFNYYLPYMGERKYKFYLPMVGKPPEQALKLQPGTPVYLPNFIDISSGCNWTGVGGQIFDKDKNPISGLVVEVTGIVDGNEIMLLALTNTAEIIGPGGFEIPIADHLINEPNNLYIQIMNLNGEFLSRRIQFNVIPACDKNLILINFVEIE